MPYAVGLTWTVNSMHVTLVGEYQIEQKFMLLTSSCQEEMITETLVFHQYQSAMTGAISHTGRM